MADIDDADEPNTETPVMLSSFVPTERMRKYKLTVLWEARGPAKPPMDPPEPTVLVVTSLDKANELRAEITPNPKFMFGPLAQIHARWGKILHVSDLSIFNFYKPIAQPPEALHDQPLRTLPGKSQSLRKRVALSAPDESGTNPPTRVPTPRGSPVSDGSSGLDLGELLGSSPVFPEREADIFED